MIYFKTIEFKQLEIKMLISATRKLTKNILGKCNKFGPVQIND